MCVLLSSGNMSQIFLILRRIKRDIATNVHWSSCKVHIILLRFQWNWNFIDKFSNCCQTSNFM